jgi:Ca2+-binding RTX toxin-like protein
MGYRLSSITWWNNSPWGGNLNLTGTAAIDGTGNAEANIITGTDAANRIDGGAGADTMTGKLGNDTYVVDDAGDKVVEAANAGNDTILTTLSLTLGLNIENGTILSTAGLQVNGNTLANRLQGGDGIDTLVGGSGNDMIDGGSGPDVFAGEAGNDVYYVDSDNSVAGIPADIIYEAANGGTDTVYADRSAGSFQLYANIETLILAGQTTYGIGNDLANSLNGNGSVNGLYGLDGNDTLVGGAGNDALFGGNGNDVFVYERGTGTDAIGDFSVAQDRIDLRAFGFGNWAQVQSAMFVVDGTTGIYLGGTDYVVINGVLSSELATTNFIIV